MQHYIDQAKHNQDFHDCIQENFNERFFDWKITVLFYIALHNVKALAAKKGIDIGHTHFEIENNISPKRHKGKMPISETAWTNYRNLFQYSQVARYDGLMDHDTFELIKGADYSNCIIHLRDFKKYISDKIK